MRDLTELRNEIDRIDHELVRLFEARMNTVREVAAYKKAHNLPVLNTGREAEVIAKGTALLEDPAFAPSLAKWMEYTMALSRASQEEQLAQPEGAC